MWSSRCCCRMRNETWYGCSGSVASRPSTATLSGPSCPIANTPTGIYRRVFRAWSERWLEALEHREVLHVLGEELRSEDVCRGGDDVVDDVDAGMRGAVHPQELRGPSGNEVGDGLQVEHREQAGDRGPLTGAHPTLDLYAR